MSTSGQFPAVYKIRYLPVIEEKMNLHVFSQCYEKLDYHISRNKIRTFSCPMVAPKLQDIENTLAYN